MKQNGLKVWIEISQAAIAYNLEVLRAKVGNASQIWAVVKSNAYGHGIYDFSPVAEKAGVDGFCVDSVIEGETLRTHGIKKTILALGSTLPELYHPAIQHKVTISISSWDALEALIAFNSDNNAHPEFHLKFDTGMYRQGFFEADTTAVIRRLQEASLAPAGIFSHLATAKDPESDFVKHQITVFHSIVKSFFGAGFTSFTSHIGSTSTVLLGTGEDFDMVRVGSGLYGFFPSPKILVKSKLILKPVLSLHSVISETKTVKAGECIGYDRTRCAKNDMRTAIVPVGYWHGVPRALSNKGSILVNGHRAPILGLISMDMTIIDITDISCKVGDPVTIIGESGGQVITTWQIAHESDTVPQELLTRLNPLIRRIVV
jgi:alanine racemase